MARRLSFGPLAIVLMGESWRNFHHAAPTGARHGGRGDRLDMSARVMRLFGKLGRANVRGSKPERLAGKLRASTQACARFAVWTPCVGGIPSRPRTCEVWILFVGFPPIPISESMREACVLRRRRFLGCRSAGRELPDGHTKG